MSDETSKKELQSVDTNTMPWGELYNEQLNRGIHASPKLVAAFPERTVELTFLDRHAKLPPPAFYHVLV
jgi:hypothetical protein